MSSTDPHERFTQLWTEAQPSVSHYIHSLVRDPAAAKDVLQATALVLLRKFGEFDLSRDFLPWALGVAKFEVLAHRRDHAREVVSFDSDLLDQLTTSWAEVATEISDEAAALQGCVGKLPDRAKRIIRMRYVDELNSKEIAAQLGRKPGNVRVMLQRIREQLRNCVEMEMGAERGTA
ncbi:MAG: sigma-70 family RNA polymerase sigma factor [Verrucomicrobiota bacterium]